VKEKKKKQGERKITCFDVCYHIYLCFSLMIKLLLFTFANSFRIIPYFNQLNTILKIYIYLFYFISVHFDVW